MTLCHQLLVLTRLMILWLPRLVGRTHLETLPRPGSKMSSRSTAHHARIPQVSEEVGARIISENETFTRKDLVPMTPSEEQWALAWGV